MNLFLLISRLLRRQAPLAKPERRYFYWRERSAYRSTVAAARARAQIQSRRLI